MRFPAPKYLTNVHLPAVAGTESAALRFICMKDYSKHANPCHSPPWKTAWFCPATSQTSPCFTVPDSRDSSCLELICHSAEAGPAFCPLLPFCDWMVLSDKWLGGRERKEHSRGDLLLSSLPVPFISGRSICPWRPAVSRWVSPLPVSHPSPPLPFLIMAEWLLQPCSQAA